MSSLNQTDLLKKLLLQNKNGNRLLSAWFALFLGCTLLLVSILIWSTFQNLLKGNGSQDSLGSTFLTISKVVDNASMSDYKKTQITETDLAKIKKAPQVQDVGLLTPANFKVSASIGNGPMSFYTLLFLESAPDRFMDQMPTTWQWEEGDNIVPIILSKDFLNMYNYIFAPSQGLPLLSEESVKAIGFTLTMGEGNLQQNYRAQVEGFSDRISSVLVPQNFIEYGNIHFVLAQKPNISRVILKVADPSDNGFVNFLENQHYSTNSEQLRFSKMRHLVDAVSTATGLLAIILIAIGALVFVLFIELTMAKAQESVKLLLQIGYSPKKISQFLLKRYTPIILSAIVLAIIVAVILQYYASLKLETVKLSISPFPSQYVWLAALFNAGILLYQIKRATNKSISQ